ncbi:hypothetical protein HDU79_011271, partial [Rhizoclosmatium sp. JEL0117]
MSEPNFDDEENTGYHYAASFYNCDIFEIVSKQSGFIAGISLKNAEGATPLTLAAKKGNYGAMKLLLDFGADIECKDNSGRTPLINAVHGGHTQTIELLLQNNATVNCKDKDGLTPLAHAALMNHLKT